MFTIAPRWLTLVLALSLFPLSALAQNVSTTVLTATPATLNEGESLGLTVEVQVPEGDPAPTGTVAITLNGATLLSLTLNHGVAETTAASTGIQAGAYTLVAQYGGDATTAPSQSAGTVVIISPNATTTTLALSPASVFDHNSASATIVVSGPAVGRKPTGTVTLLIGSTAFDKVRLADGTATVSAPASTLADGVYSLSAAYSGDAFNSASTSPAQQLTVFGHTTSLFTITPAVQTVGSPATVSVVITGDGPKTPTGTVDFYLGQKLLVKAPVVNGAVSLPESTSGLAPGNYVITAKYSGDAANNPATATALVHLNATAPAYTITPAGAAMAAGRKGQFAIDPAPDSTVTWYVNNVAGGTSATGTIDSNGNYTAPLAPVAPVAVTVTASEASSPQELAAAVPVYVVVPGTVSNSNNPQVARYSMGLPPGGEMSVDFGLDTSYGLNTWTQPTPAGGGTQTMLVAGMMAPATYHMKAQINFANGISYRDADRTFNTTLVFPPPTSAVVTSAPGMTPQPGIEVANTPGDHFYGYDMAGNFVWGMTFPSSETGPSIFQPIKQMPNGHLLVQISPENAFPVDGSIVPAGTTISIYEMELDGTIVRELTIDQLNTNLAASGYRDVLGNQITLLDMHHEVTLNPVTGHWLIDANTIQVETNDPGTTGPTNVLGDVIIDVDPNNNFAVDWVWNSFDHLDVTRHPGSIQDWTHTNALVYSPTDHNLLISMRYQNWVLKVDYDDAAGAGDIIWRFGYQGDFTLVNGTSPQDWVWGQHEPAFTTKNTTGVFGLTMMDNGLNRPFSSGYDCEDGTAKPCHYSRVPQFTVDETNMTATLGPVMPYDGYSYYGGNGEILPNGDSHADFCAVVDSSDPDSLHGVVEEYTGGDNPQLVWSLDIGGVISLYRSHRWTSFYPGVTWTKTMIAPKTH